MPIFQGFWKDKEKEEDRFLFSIPLLSRGFHGEKNLGREEEKTSLLQGLILFLFFFYIRVAKTNF